MIAPKNESKKKSAKLMYFISKKVGKAIADYNMLKDGDKILVAVSGGKDSLTLLKMLKYRQTFVPIHFDIVAAHIDTFGGGLLRQTQDTSPKDTERSRSETPPFRVGKDCAALSINPERLRQYSGQTPVFRPKSRRIDFGNSFIQSKALSRFCRRLGVEYFVKKSDILKRQPPKDTACFWCAWNRRKMLFELAVEKGCNKVALGHHLDDIVETVLLNLFYQGQISAMKPRQELFNGKITIIRPLAYIEEKEIERFARLSRDFPYNKCRCPNAVDSKRKTVEKIIKELSRESPHIKKNIFKSIKRIKKDYLL